MTILNKIFRKKGAVQLGLDPAATPSISKELFIEERHPKDLTGPEKEVQVIESTLLETLLARDYFAMGRRDGYEDHNVELMEMQVDLIVSAFRQEFFRALQDIEVRIEEIDLYLTPKMQEVMPEHFERIQIKKEQLQKQKREVISQMDLATMGQGYIEQTVRQYKAGFRKGFSFYREEKLTFDHIKIL